MSTPSTPAPRPWPRWLLLVALALHGWLQLAPAWQKTADTPSARDYASYYYAVKVAADGGDPYDVGALGRLSRAENTRRTVQPYFYPPPFLLTQLWALPLSLHTASFVMLVLNELLLGACLFLTWRCFAVAPAAIALILATYSPIPDNAWMGQANLLALLPTLLGLAWAGRRPWLGGIAVGVAGMLKMSPALFLVYWAIRRNLRAFLAAAGTAVALSLLTLPLVGTAWQIEFFREVLPGFLVGDYHGLTVPISLPANHSIPDIFARMWPGDTPTSMSETALRASRFVNLAALGAWGFVTWRNRRAPDSPAALDRWSLGALTILMTILPAYTYEHHLVFLLLPAGLFLTWGWDEARRGALAKRVAVGLLTVSTWFFLAWPLLWLTAGQKRFPALGDTFRESKFLAMLVILAVMLALAGRRDPAPEPTA